jgi:hypothetical protein
MLTDITKRVRAYIAAQAGALKCNAGRAADRESALLWLVENTGNGWAVCVTVGGVEPDGDEEARRNGRVAVTLRLFMALTPGLPKDADKRVEELHLAWSLVWSYMMRARWGRSRDGQAEGERQFIPADGFLDGDRPMLPGGAEFSREVFTTVGNDGKPAARKELLLATQEWSTLVSLPILGPALSDGETDTNLYL